MSEGTTTKRKKKEKEMLTGIRGGQNKMITRQRPMLLIFL